MPKVFIKTYGCQMNERDSEQVAQMLIARGYEMTSDEMVADVVLLNTCSVRDMAEQKAIGKMGNLIHKKRNQPAILGFLGCMAQSRGAELTKMMGVDLVVGTQKFHKVADYVDELYQKKIAESEAEDAFYMDDLRYTIVDVEPEAGSQETIREHTLKEHQHTAFVSIMQGCNMKCTFCIVPYTRGSERSRAIPEIVKEVEELVARGIKEVTLLGQIVNLYGRHEFPKIDDKGPFVQLLEAVHNVEGLERLRFTSPHPIGYKQDLIEAFRYLPKLVEHIHLPLQSGSKSILRAMHRTYTPEKFEELVARIREVRPDMAITTDIIVGFPGETEEDYLATRSLVERVQFDNAFVFRYSQRRGTPAADLPGQLDEATKDARNQDLLEVVDATAKRKLEALVGSTVEVLCEGPSRYNPEKLTGRTRGNKIVIFEGPERLYGQIFDVKIEHAAGFSLYGTPALVLA